MKQYSVILLIMIITGALSVGWQQKDDKTQPETMELIPMMRLLLADMYSINEGIYVENYAMIEKGGNSIAHHPVMTEEDKKLISENLGEEFRQFVNYDMIVHHHADSLAKAAQMENMNEVLKHYRIVQRGCVDCHTDFRKRIIEARSE